MKKKTKWDCTQCHRYIRVNGRHACTLTRGHHKSYRLLPRLLTWPENFDCFWLITTRRE